MSIQRIPRNGKARWKVRWLEDGQHRARTFDRKDDAQAFEAGVRRRLQLGAHAPAEPSRMRLGEWLATWFDRDSPRWAASTRMHRGYVLDKWIAPSLSGVRLMDLGSKRVREWQADVLRDGCSQHQANQSLRILSAALGAAARDGLLPSNPCVGVSRLRHTPKRPRALAPIEVERLRFAMPSLRDVVLLGLLAYAGLRPEEALALRWEDVGTVLTIDRAFTHGELKGTKTHQRRSVEVIAPLAADLDLLRPKLVDPEALVAPSETGGHLNLNNWRNRVWSAACATAEVKATPYDGRHTYASLLIHEGLSPLLVAAAMGHSSASTTIQYYGHIIHTARLEPMVSMVAAVQAARAQVARTQLPPACLDAPVRMLRAAATRTKT